jgi:hypothetical protein
MHNPVMCNSMMFNQSVDSKGQLLSAVHSQVASYHSELAMEAAKKMRRSRQKQKVGQQVCHHLKMMLAIEVKPRDLMSGSRVANDAQFSLGI